MRALLLAAFLATASGAAATTFPVVIIPGDGSNQLEARLHKPSKPHFFCTEKSSWYRLWLSATQLVPGAVDCWADNMRLVVNASTGRAVNSPGVETRVPYWGSTEGFEELDPSIPAHKSAAFYQMVQALLADSTLGLVKNSTLRGAPYDFRYTPDSPQGLSTTALAKLVQETSDAAGGAKVTLISHSMGGLQTQYFLQQQSAQWKARYIRQWIPISAPWIGAAKEWRLFATGDPSGLPVSAISIRDEQRSSETNVWMLPLDGDQAGFNDTVFVSTPAKNYTVNNYDEFFDDIKWSVGKVVRPRVHGLMSPFTAPGVPVHCLYSTGVDTPFRFSYSGQPADFTKDPTITTSDGDGTVPEQSLRVCKRWKDDRHSGFAANVTTYENIDHTGMIQNPAVISDVIAIIKSGLTGSGL